jgi:hypothetical protein
MAAKRRSLSVQGVTLCYIERHNRDGHRWGAPIYLDLGRLLAMTKLARSTSSTRTTNAPETRGRGKDEEWAPWVMVATTQGLRYDSYTVKGKLSQRGSAWRDMKAEVVERLRRGGESLAAREALGGSIPTSPHTITSRRTSIHLMRYSRRKVCPHVLH